MDNRAAQAGSYWTIEAILAISNYQPKAQGHRPAQRNDQEPGAIRFNSFQPHLRLKHQVSMLEPGKAALVQKISVPKQRDDDTQEFSKSSSKCQLSTKNSYVYQNAHVYSFCCRCQRCSCRHFRNVCCDYYGASAAPGPLCDRKGRVDGRQPSALQASEFG